MHIPILSFCMLARCEYPTANLAGEHHVTTDLADKMVLVLAARRSLTRSQGVPKVFRPARQSRSVLLPAPLTPNTAVISAGFRNPDTFRRICSFVRRHPRPRTSNVRPCARVSRIDWGWLWSMRASVQCLGVNTAKTRDQAAARCICATKPRQATLRCVTARRL